MFCSFCYLKVWYYLLQFSFCLDIKSSILQFQLLSFQYASFICQRSTTLMFKSTQFYNCLWLNAQVMRFEVSHNLWNQIEKGKLISSEPFLTEHRRCSVRKGVLRNFVKFRGKYLLLLRNFAVSRVDMEKKLHKDMVYTIEKIWVSGFRKSTGSISRSWAKHFTGQNVNALKISKNSKTYETFMVIVWELDQGKAYIFPIK